MALWTMASALRLFAPDVLHVQCFSVNGVYAAALARIFRTPLVVSLQGETVMDDHDIYERSASLRLGLRIGLRTASAVTGCSESCSTMRSPDSGCNAGGVSWSRTAWIWTTLSSRRRSRCRSRGSCLRWDASSRGKA